MGGAVPSCTEDAVGGPGCWSSLCRHQPPRPSAAPSETQPREGGLAIAVPTTPAITNGDGQGLLDPGPEGHCPLPTASRALSAASSLPPVPLPHSGLVTRTHTRHLLTATLAVSPGCHAAALRPKGPRGLLVPAHASEVTPLHGEPSPTAPTCPRAQLHTTGKPRPRAPGLYRGPRNRPGKGASTVAPG